MHPFDEALACFRSNVREAPDRVAVAAPDGSVTFAELDRAAESMGRALVALGVPQGPPIGLCLPNSAAFVPAVLALWKHGAPVVLMSSKLGIDELEHAVGRLGLGHVVAGGAAVETIGRLHPAPRTTPIEGPMIPPGIVLAQLAVGSARGEAALRMEAALVKLTSGSTAEPKAVALTAGNVLTEARNVVRSLGIGPGDQILVPVPMTHSYGFDLGVLPLVVAGARIVTCDVFVPRRLLRDMADRASTIVLGVPSMYRAILETHRGEAPSLDHLRYILSCTAPLSADLIRRFAERLRAPICQHYGSSESGGATLHVPSEVAARPASVGRAMDGVSVTVAGPDGAATADGAEGEVIITSGAVASGYLMGAPAGPSPLGEGRFASGDIGRLDRDGFLEILGRKDAVINVGGMKVSPLEIARVLEACQAVSEAAAAGHTDEAGETAVYAAVVCRAPCSEEELLSFCRERLAEYKVPRRIHVVGELPRTATGKVIWRPGAATGDA